MPQPKQILPEAIDLSFTSITDRRLTYLQGDSMLAFIHLPKTSVSEEALRDLSTAIPEAMIVTDARRQNNLSWFSSSARPTVGPKAKIEMTPQYDHRLPNTFKSQT